MLILYLIANLLSGSIDTTVYEEDKEWDKGKGSEKGCINIKIDGQKVEDFEKEMDKLETSEIRYKKAYITCKEYLVVEGVVDGEQGLKTEKNKVLKAMRESEIINEPKIQYVEVKYVAKDDSKKEYLKVSMHKMILIKLKNLKK